VLFLLFALHDAGATRTIVFAPYLAFACTQVRDPVNVRYVAQLLETTEIVRFEALAHDLCSRHQFVIGLG
jgi:hypothetical protein